MFGSIRNVNPLKSATNCVHCAIATDLTLSGRPTSALPSAAKPLVVLENHYGRTFRQVSGRDQIENIMSNAGHGARGIVAVYKGGNQTGHVFNVTNQNGTVRLLDGQIGTVASLEGYIYFAFMRTNGHLEKV